MPAGWRGTVALVAENVGVVQMNVTTGGADMDCLVRSRMASVHLLALGLAGTHLTIAFRSASWPLGVIMKLIS